MSAILIDSASDLPDGNSRPASPEVRAEKSKPFKIESIRSQSLEDEDANEPEALSSSARIWKLPFLVPLKSPQLSDRLFDFKQAAMHGVAPSNIAESGSYYRVPDEEWISEHAQYARLFWDNLSVLVLSLATTYEQFTESLRRKLPKLRAEKILWQHLGESIESLTDPELPLKARPSRVITFIAQMNYAPQEVSSLIGKYQLRGTRYINKAKIDFFSRVNLMLSELPEKELHSMTSRDLFHGRCSSTKHFLALTHEADAFGQDLFTLVKGIFDAEQRFNHHAGSLNLAYAKLILKYTQRYRSSTRSLIDLFQEGTEAVFAAARRFNPDLGFKFSTVLTQQLDQRFQKVSDNDAFIPLPAHTKGKERPISVVHENESVDSEGEQGSGISPVASAAVEGQDDRTLQLRHLNSVVKESLSQCNLSEREFLVARHLYGLDGVEVLTLQRIGQMFNPPVGRERVRQLETKILEKLSNHLKRLFGEEAFDILRVTANVESALDRSPPAHNRKKSEIRKAS